VKCTTTVLGLVVMASFAVDAIGVSGAGAATVTLAHAKKAPKKGCSSFQPGKKGVTQTFCTGKGVITLTVAGTTTIIKGGSCTLSGPYFAVNAGVVVGLSFKGTKPNYFGLDASKAPGAFTNATIAYTVGGKGGFLTKNTGTTNHKTGTFAGTDLAGNAVSGSFTC
jgi:hypothetical protein